MKTKELESHRQRLLELREDLVKRVRSLEDTLETLDADREVEFMDRAQADVPEEVLVQLDEQEREQLAEIEAALERIAHSSYGPCERCGKVIDERRLGALPYARLCIECQTAAETSGDHTRSKH